MEVFKIKGPFITLGKFIKIANLVSSGGMVKPFLLEGEVYHNNEKENRRGKKIYPGDVVIVNGLSFKFVND